MAKRFDVYGIGNALVDMEFEITEERSRVINLASIVVAPFAMFIAGIVTWATRRRK